MSGGSFNYLYLREISAISNYELKEMAQFFRDNEMIPAALATEKLIRPEPSEKLRELWHCVEWFESGDYGSEQVSEAYDNWLEAQ